MKLYAIVFDKYSKNKTKEVMEFDNYTTKKQCKEEIRGNGYAIVNNFIYNEEEWKNDEISWKLHERKVKKNIRNKAKASVNKFLKSL